MTLTTLRGRAAESTALRRTRRGVVIVTGEPGIGRTALLRTETEHAAADGFAALATARPGDRIAPLSTLAPVLRPLLSADALHTLADLQDKPLWLAERLATVIAAKAPATIAVDDVDQADALSAFLLRTLPARLAGAPVRWLLSAREAPADLDGHRLPLGPLSREALAEMATDRLGHRPDAELRTRLADADGLPWLAVRIIDGDTAGLAHDVRQRLAYASPRCRSLVTAASVLEQPIRLDDAGLLLGETAVDLIAPLAEAIALGLLADGDDGMSFRHDLVRRAVADDLTPSARHALRSAAIDLGPAAGPTIGLAPTMGLGLTMDEELDALLKSEAPRPAGGGDWSTLTAMEERVAVLISDGHTNRSAAATLHLSPSTVSTHLRAVFAKLNINSRVQLTRLAMRRA